MSFGCVLGSRECDGCMRCQVYTEYEEHVLEGVEKMNNVRRKKISQLVDKLHTIFFEVEDLLDEEKGALDNMPESLESSDRYSQMEEAISNLEDAMDSIEEVVDYLESASV